MRAGFRGDHPGYSLSRVLGGTVDASPRRWITSPAPSTNEKKEARVRLMEIASANPEWAIGFEDECWWSTGWRCLP